MHAPDDRDIEFRRPMTIEDTLADISYRKHVADHIDVQIMMMTELIQDLCQRVIALEAARHD